MSSIQTQLGGHGGAGRQAAVDDQVDDPLGDLIAALRTRHQLAPRTLHFVGTPTRRTSYVAPAEAVSCESWAMGFVIQIVSGKAEARAVVLDVPGRADTPPGTIWARKPRSGACRTRPKLDAMPTDGGSPLALPDGALATTVLDAARHHEHPPCSTTASGPTCTPGGSPRTGDSAPATEFDPSCCSTPCALHDIGTADAYDGPSRSRWRGGRGGRAAHRGGVDAGRVDQVWEAIACTRRRRSPSGAAR